MAAAVLQLEVWTERKRIEDLRYMHRNPMKERTGAGTGAMGVEQFFAGTATEKRA